MDEHGPFLPIVTLDNERRLKRRAIGKDSWRSTPFPAASEKRGEAYGNDLFASGRGGDSLAVGETAGTGSGAVNLEVLNELSSHEQNDSRSEGSLTVAQAMRWTHPKFWTLLQFGLLALSVGVFAACTGGKQLSGGNPDMITQEQIQQVGTTSNAYVLVQRLHPDWLQKRGTSSVRSVSDVVVYVEGSRRGGPGTLRQINVMNVKSIEHLSSDQATLEYGSGHDHGAIRVELKEMN